jgi:hypothetical protein
LYRVLLLPGDWENQERKQNNIVSGSLVAG